MRQLPCFPYSAECRSAEQKGRISLLGAAHLAAIVAASNAGGAGSVIGDTTTTTMWIDGVSAFVVLNAFIGSIGAFLFFAPIASLQQDRHQRIVKSSKGSVKIEWGHLLVVVLILAGAVATNVTLDFPALGAWGALLAGSLFRKTEWRELLIASRGALFLVGLVLCASMMPVEQLPSPTWKTSLSLGLLSGVFDNIPLTKLALDQGGYDWAVLAYAVGFGGSMTLFGSSAGVAVSNLFPESCSVFHWIKGGWHVWIGYVVGFFLLIAINGWRP